MTEPDLPAEIEDALARLLDEPAERRTLALQRLCSEHPGHASAIHRIASVWQRFGSEVTSPPPPPPDQLGPYRVLRELGSGGMGTVYLGEQFAPVHRVVAIKVIRPGLYSRDVLLRFERERRALAAMDHTNIAKVFDAGALPDGRPWFSMEYVDGAPITRYCDRHSLSVEDRLALFVQVCAGVRHAHQKGVIHRDLTPNNVLVSRQDDRHLARIIDFGLARAIDPGQRQQTLLTAHDVVVGTPEYMSPEQTSGADAAVDTRTDIYTLGVMLYELLSGCLPFDRGELWQAGWEGVCRMIREREPPRPSTRLGETGAAFAAVAANRRTAPQTLLRRLRGDLDWIVLKCLAKEPERRYATVHDVAADVERHLADHPVEARAPSLGYRLRKLARRHRGALVAAALLLAAITIGLGGTIWFLFAAREQRTLAETRAIEVQKRIDDFNLLSGVVRLAQARAAAAELFPPWPERSAAIRAWLHDQGEPLEAFCSRVTTAVQRLAEHALPRDAREDQTERESQPEFHSWQQAHTRLRAQQRAAAVRAGQLPLDLPLITGPQPSSRATMGEIWDLVELDPARRIWGKEAEALSRVRDAWDRLQPEDAGIRPRMAVLLALAYLANGRDHEAATWVAQALAETTPATDAGLQSMAQSLPAIIADLGKPEYAQQMAEEQRRLDAIEERLNQRRAWHFADPADSFLHDTLRRLHADLQEFVAKDLPDVRHRLAWADRIAGLSIDSQAARWSAARTAIRTADGVTASTLYAATPIDLRPQMGLVPIGMNPVTRLWEFADLGSATHPEQPLEHRLDGSLPVNGDSGLVFVLLPGNTTWLGAQSDDPAGPCFDPAADRTEGPPRRVATPPFLLSRYEMTKGQWLRLAGGVDPSWFQIGVRYDGIPQRINAAFPVDSITLFESVALLRRNGMLVPTANQWEMACRSGTTTPWFTGSTALSLRGFANTCDQTMNRTFPGWRESDGFDDGYAGPAPVGTYSPNPFGLHDMHGNVSEWVWSWDARQHEATPELEQDGQQARGGGADFNALSGRASSNNRLKPGYRGNCIGVRPARALRG